MRGDTNTKGIGSKQSLLSEASEQERYERLTSMLTRFIGRSSLEEAIKSSIQDLCRMSGASNGLIYLAPEEGATFGERYEWCREKVCSHLRLTMLAHEVLSGWMTTLEREKVIYIEDVMSATPDTCGYYEDLESMGMRSLLVLPLQSDGKPEGFLTLVTTSDKDGWSTEDIDWLSAVTRALGGAVERKQGDHIMRSVDKVRAIVLDSVSELVTLMDPDLKILWGNRAAADSLGMTPQQLIGRHCYELWHHREEPCVGCPIVQSLGSGGTERGEIITPDGRMWHLNGYPVRNSAGEIVGIAEVTTDITELKRTAVELRKSEEKFRTLVEHSLQGVAVVQDYRIVFANSALADLCGYSLKELVSKRPSEIKELVHPDDQDMVWGRFRDRLAGKPVDSRYSFRIISKDGIVRWVEMFATRIEYLGKPGVQATMIDITSRKRLDEKLKEEDTHSYSELIS